MKPFAAALAVGACLAASACGACEPNGPPPGADAGAAAASVASPPGASGSGQPAAIAPHLAHAPNRLACRAIAVDGDVHVDTGADAGTTPLLLQGLVPTEAWVALAKGARFVAKDPRTTRETTFLGPGRARACVDYGEESWVESGTFESSVGAGETPGAEEWVVTPLGVARYAAAKLSVEVRPADVTVAVASGVAFVWTPDDVSPSAQLGKGSVPPAPLPLEEGWRRVDANAKATLAPPSGRAASSPLDGARNATAQCTTLSSSTRELAIVLLGGADAGTIGQQVTTRRLARAACAVAAVRIHALPPSGAAASLTASLGAAREQWNTLPTLGAP
jgi:hypothetical protein